MKHLTFRALKIKPLPNYESWTISTQRKLIVVTELIKMKYNAKIIIQSKNYEGSLEKYGQIYSFKWRENIVVMKSMVADGIQLFLIQVIKSRGNFSLVQFILCRWTSNLLE